MDASFFKREAAMKITLHADIQFHFFIQWKPDIN